MAVPTATGGRQSAIERSTRSRHVVTPREALSMTWPNAQMFDDNGMTAAAAGRQSHYTQQLQPLVQPTSPGGSSESDRGHAGTISAQ
jgi:hypothetical protein